MFSHLVGGKANAGWFNVEHSRCSKSYGMNSTIKTISLM